jgi:hypothetical protein
MRATFQRLESLEKTKGLEPKKAKRKHSKKKTVKRTGKTQPAHLHTITNRTGNKLQNKTP